MTAPPSPSVAALRKEFGDAIGRHVVSCGDTVVYVSRERVHDVLRWLKETPGQGYTYLTDITAVDYRDPECPLEVVWQLRALDRPADLRVKVALPAGQPLEVPTVWDLWRGANWLEREVFDMFGVTFSGHPNLRRMLMPFDWQGHPQRKDYPLEGPGELLMESPQDWLKARQAAVEADSE